MFVQAATITFRILLFRAGPQDMPYSQELTRVLLPAAVVANFWIFSMALPLAMSAAMALAMIAGVALITNTLLKARRLGDRFNQTFNALLATGAVLTLLLLPPFAQVAPTLVKATQNPQMLEHPENLELPQGAVMLMNLLNFWNLGVTAHIFRHAMNVSFGFGVLFALLAAFTALFIVMISGSMIGAILA